MSGPKISSQLYVQANFPRTAGSQRQSIQNIEVVRMLEFIQKIHQAFVISLDCGADIDFHQPSGIGSVLVKRNCVGAQTSRMRQLSKVFADRGIAGTRGTEVRGKEFVPLFFIGGEFRAGFFVARVVRPGGFFLQLETSYLIRSDSRPFIELVIDAQKNDVKRQNDDEAPADDCFTLLNNYAHLK